MAPSFRHRVERAALSRLLRAARRLNRTARTERGEWVAADTRALMLVNRLASPGGAAPRSPDAFRAEMRRHAAVLGAQPDAFPGVRSRDIQVDGAVGMRDARLYTTGRGTGRPLLLFLHGGGFVGGDLETHDGLCRRLADRAGLTVLSVTYRLAPEAPYPAPVDDAIAAYGWALDHAASLGAAPHTVALAGDSAGGALSAVISHHCAATKQPAPAAQLLIYPLTEVGAETDSRRRLGAEFGLTNTMIDWFDAHYRPASVPRSEPRISPGLSPHIAQMPPTHILVADLDPLRDEGLTFAAALDAAGVPTTTQRVAGLPHGFATWTAAFPAGAAAIDEAAHALSNLLDGSVS